MPGRQPFTHTSPPRNKPFAIGESGWHLPATGPSCSGEEALASLTGYYPHRRMDSILNPHTYKVAALRTEYARIKVASMRQATSGLIRGFFEKCAAAGMTDEAILQAAYRAIELHPSLAREFKAVGIEKQAIGGFNGAPGTQHFAPKPSGPAAPAPTPAATVRPPTPVGGAGGALGTAAGAAVSGPKYPPISSPSRASLLTGRMPTPAPTPAQAPAAAAPHPAPFSLPAMPNPSNVRPANGVPSTYKPQPRGWGEWMHEGIFGNPVSRWMAGSASPQSLPPGYKPPPEMNIVGRQLTHAGNAGLGVFGTTAGALGTLGGMANSGLSRVTDGLGLTQGWTVPADAFTQSMADSTRSMMVNTYAGLSNQDPQVVAYNWRKPENLIFNNPDGIKPVDQMRQDHRRQLHDGGGVDMPLVGHISPEIAAATYNLLNNVSDTAGIAALVGRAGKMMGLSPELQSKGMSLPLFMGTGGEALGSGVNTVFDSKSLADYPSNFVQGMPSFQEGMVHPDQVMSTGISPDAQPGADGRFDQSQIIAKMRNGNRVPLSETTGPGGRGPAMLPDGRTPLPSGIEGTPGYADIANLATQDPEQAQQLAGQAAGQLKGALGSKAGQTEVGSVMKSGTLSPQGMQQAAVALTSQGYDTDKAMGIIKGMNGWEQLGLWGGLGLAGVGLLHAMSGGGGMASIIMALLGLGTAGFTAGKTGLLDQGSQDLTQGLTNAVTGQKTTPTMDAVLKGVKPALPGAIDLAEKHPDTAKFLLQQLASASPDIARQLDQAAGVGSWGNSAMSMLGNLALPGRQSYRQQQMQQLLGLDNARQDKLLDIWRRARAQPR